MRTVILSETTLAALLEAHASMAAWHYELWRALREGSPPRTPDEATRKAFLARVASDFPEVAATANSVDSPRLYVPPPPAVEPPAMVDPPLPSGEGAE